jgi:hypothetical protein
MGQKQDPLLAAYFSYHTNIAASLFAQLIGFVHDKDDIGASEQ